MTGAEGSFPLVTCASSPCESGPFEGGAVQPNVYSLQLNTNYTLPATSSCSGASAPSACHGWQQFIYDSYLKEIRIEPALIGYGSNPCPAPFILSDGFGNCYDENENSTTVPQLTPQQLNTESAKFLGQVGLVGGTLTDTVKLILSGTTAYAATSPDSLLNLSGHWNIAQFGIYGDRGAGEANFAAGTDLKVNLMTHSGTTMKPQCVAFNSTGESNNLFLQPAPVLAIGAAPSIESEQSSNPSATPPACAAARGYGEIHLGTFGCASCSQTLTYPFQATGDFQLADAPLPTGGPPFNVQTRLVPFPPNPDLSVSQDVAAQIGRSQVALCNAQPLRLDINAQAVQLADGQRLALPGGGSVSRQGNVYLIQDSHGDTVQVEPDSYLGANFLKETVGLGRWPTPVTGLLANAPNQAGAVQSKTGAVLASPFPFSKFYNLYGNSWRVTASQDLLSPACGAKFASGNPATNYDETDLTSQQRQHAQKICAKVPAALLDPCILDVATLGDKAVNVYQTLPGNTIWGSIIPG
jgi:hypothetical protein